MVELQQRPEYIEACEQTPGCTDAQTTDDSDQLLVWRVQVSRDENGEVVIGLTETVSVPADPGLPPGRVTGDYLLVGVDRDGAPVDGQMILFPRERRWEVDGQAPIRESLEGQPTSTMGYLRADHAIVRLELRDAEDQVVAEQAPPPVSDENALRRWWSPNIIDDAYALTSLTRGVPSHCAHIWVLQGEVDRPFTGSLAMVEEVAVLEPPGPFQMAAVKAALNRFTPLTCGAVRRIAFARIDLLEQQMAGAVMFAGEGDMIVVNTASYPESELAGNTRFQLHMQTTLTHESGHAVEALLNAEGEDAGVYGGDWDVPNRTRARTTLDNARLHKGFGEEWRRIHTSFVEAGYARDYSLAGFADPMEDGQVVDSGFMTSYGSNIWWDDIAEFLSEIIMGPEFRSAGLTSYDLACQAMQAWNDASVPSQLATAYTKVMFLQDLGIVRQAYAADCTGPNLGLNIANEGFHFWQEGSLRRSFTSNLEASIGTKALVPTKVFDMSAEGTVGFGDASYPAKIEMRLTVGGVMDDIVEVSWPRGVYPLSRSGDNGLTLTLDGAKAGNFQVMDGFVMVAEATNQRITGSAVVQRVWRPLAPIPVPERYDPPLVIRFMIKK